MQRDGHVRRIRDSFVLEINACFRENRIDSGIAEF